MAEPIESRLLAGVGAFLKQHGLATLIAVVAIWVVLDDRRAGASATATQLKDLNGQLLHLSGLLSEHHDQAKSESKEMSRILLAQCLNLATDSLERSRCLDGPRRNDFVLNP